MNSSEPVVAPPVLGSTPSPSADNWMADPERSRMILFSLDSRVRDMMTAEANCRKAFTKPYMSEPANWLADVFAEAAELFDRRRATIRRSEVIAYAKSLQLANGDQEEPVTAETGSGYALNSPEPSGGE